MSTPRIECAQAPGHTATHEVLIRYDPKTLVEIPYQVAQQYAGQIGQFGSSGKFCLEHAKEYRDGLLSQKNTT